MARVLMQQQQKVSATPACAPTEVPRAAQVGRGPVAEAVARHLAVQAERDETARVAAQAERDRCSATARLLASGQVQDGMREQQQLWLLPPTPHA